MMSSKMDRNLKEIIDKIKSAEITRIEPVFQPRTGLVFKWFETYPFDELKQALDTLEQQGILGRVPYSSTLKCRYCNSYRLRTQFICTVCRSSNVTRGAVIEHLLCGNIDLDEKYVTADGSLVCNKCRKRVNAIGVDYARPGFFYTCAHCHATLPNTDNQYVCIECGNPSSIDELQVQQLFAYVVINQEKLVAAAKETGVLTSVVETLNKIGIKSAFMGEVPGKTGTKHAFELVVYDDEGEAILVAETMKGDHAGEPEIAAFQARCEDAKRMTKKIFARILIALPRFSQKVNQIVGTLGIIVIQSETKEQAISQLVRIILRTYTEDKGSKLSR